MGEVLKFPQANSEDAKAAIRESRLAHGRRIRDRLGTPWVLQRGEPEEVAKALHRLLERITGPKGKCGQRGISKAKILSWARFTTGDPTKHLSQYTLPPDASELDARIARLRKKAKSYAKIAHAAAELSGADADDVLGEVFASVRLNASADGIETPPEYHELAATLRHAMEGIARRFDLTSYFKEVEASGLMAFVEPKWEAEEKALRELQDADLDVSFSQTGFYDWDIRFGRPTAQAAFESDGYISCYPAVTLGSWAIGEPVPMKVAITERFDPPITAEIEVQYVAELRLCIAPIEPDCQPKPALRIAVRAMIEPIAVPPRPEGVDAPGAASDSAVSGRSCTEIVLNEYWNMPMRIGAELRGEIGCYSSTALRVEEIRKPLPKLVLDSGYFGDSAGDRPSSDGVRFFPIDGRILRDWLGFNVMREQYEFWNEREVSNVFYGEESGAAGLEHYYGGYSPFPSGSLAAAIDQSLCAEQATRLRGNIVDELADRAERLTTALADAIEKGQSRRQQRLDKLRQRWAPEGDAE